MKRIIHYRMAMLVFQQWQSSGIITEEELARIETLIALKYGLSQSSLYRVNTCNYCITEGSCQ